MEPRLPGHDHVQSTQPPTPSLSEYSPHQDLTCRNTVFHWKFLYNGCGGYGRHKLRTRASEGGCLMLDTASIRCFLFTGKASLPIYALPIFSHLQSLQSLGGINFPYSRLFVFPRYCPITLYSFSFEISSCFKPSTDNCSCFPSRIGCQSISMTSSSILPFLVTSLLCLARVAL